MGELDSKQSSPDLITKVGVAVTASSVIALVISYLNHLMFYSFFGLPINNFIQVGEAVVLFMPQLIDYAFKIVGVLVLWEIMFRFMRSSDSTVSESLTNSYRKRFINKQKNRYGHFDDPLEIYDNLRRLKLYKVIIRKAIHLRKWSRIVTSFGEMIISSFRLLFTTSMFCIGPFILLHPYLLLDRDFSHRFGIITLASCFFGASVSISIIIDYISYGYIETFDRKISNKIFMFKFVVNSLILIYLQSALASDNIKLGNSDYEVEFTYDNRRIKTSQYLVYIGGSQNFVFLRDRKLHKNNVYKMEKIDNYSIRKIEYEDVWIWDKP